VRAYSDPRLYAINLLADRFATSTQPIVPERLLVMGGGTDGGGVAGASSNVLSQLVALLLAEKAGVGFASNEAALAELDRALHAAAAAGAAGTGTTGAGAAGVEGQEVERA